MKPTTLLLSSVLALSLSACGGGGGGGDSATPATSFQSTAQLGDFDAVWKLEAASNRCVHDFPFTNAPTHYRLRDMTLVSTKDQITASLAFEVFSDTTCTSKLGLVTESFDWNPKLATIADTDNAVQATPVWTGVSITRDGGAGLTLNGMPTRNDTVTGWEGGLKLIVDVQGKKLLHQSSDAGVALDAQGFPRQFDPKQFFVKN